VFKRMKAQNLFQAPRPLLWRWLGANVLVVIAALLALPNHPIAQVEQSIVVLVNDDPISAYDIEQRERFLAVTAHEQPGPALKKKATDMLIDERLQLQQGKKLGITPDDADVNRILGDMATKNNLTTEGLASALGQMGVNIRTLKDRIRSQTVWQDVVRRQFRREVTIGDIDVDKALAAGGEGAQAEGASEATALQLRQIKFEVSGSDQRTLASKIAEAEALRARFESCNNVGDLTKGIKGASIKVLADQQPGGLAQPARLLVMNAKVGQITPPTISANGVELYAVCGKRSVKGNAQQREQTEHKLVQQEMEIRAERLLRDLRQDAFIEYRS
jgi:peptidyl-prolyl cis-trans isomerase SurA